MYHKNRGNRRWVNSRVVKRKLRIVHELGDYWHYKYPGILRKGKIHCSCPMCACKTSGKINKSRGPVSTYSFTGDDGKIITMTRSSRLAVTNHRLGKKNYKASDRRHMISDDE